MTLQPATPASGMPVPAAGDAPRAQLEGALLADGYALLPSVLDPAACASLRERFADEAAFRSHIVMARHGFGRGDYKYFRYPLIEPVARLREEFYAVLAPIANRWNEGLGRPQRFPATQQTFLDFCADHDQSRPTALLLRYRSGDYNCLHEDVYGDVAFPFQMTVFLSERRAYEGGEFVLVEQRPRKQSRPIVLRPQRGDALVFRIVTAQSPARTATFARRFGTALAKYGRASASRSA